MVRFITKATLPTPMIRLRTASPRGCDDLNRIHEHEVAGLSPVIASVGRDHAQKVSPRQPGGIPSDEWRGEFRVLD